MSKKDNGSGNVPSIEQQQQEAIIGALYQEIFVTLAQFSQLTSEQCVALATSMTQEQLVLVETVLPTLLTGNEATKTHPTIVTFITNGKTKGMLEANKRLEGVTDPGQALHTAMTFALLSSAPARAMLKAFGFDLRFAQTAKKLETPGNIVLG